MSRLPGITGKQLIAALERMGFEEIRVRGSHHYLRHPMAVRRSWQRTQAKQSAEVSVSKVLRDAKITREDLSAYL